ncbi:MAG TPA: hypothetical protein PLL90_00575 [Bacteroidales bacterium]|nr:hypothetical protein [Bacteroidales bacterium]
MKFIKTSIFFCLFFFPNIVLSQYLQFYREDLTFEIKDGFFYVDGIYNFCNNGDKEIKQVLYYPFPFDSLYGGVDSINAIDVNAKSQKIILNITEKGFLFKIALNPYGIGKYKISYRQKLLKNKAEYILVTTQKWGTPFESSNYKLITSDNMKITSTSYIPDSTKQISDKEIYYWSKKDFMPDKNMIFYFDR